MWCNKLIMSVCILQTVTDLHILGYLLCPSAGSQLPHSINNDFHHLITQLLFSFHFFTYPLILQPLYNHKIVILHFVTVKPCIVRYFQIQSAFIKWFYFLTKLTCCRNNNFEKIGRNNKLCNHNYFSLQI